MRSPPPDSGTIIAALPTAVIMFALSIGVKPFDLYTRLGIDPEDLANPDALVPYEVMIEVWRVLIEFAPDRALGLEHARNARFALFGALGYATRNAPTVGAAMATLTRFHALLDPKVRFRQAMAGGIWRLELEHEDRVIELGEPMDSIVGASVCLMRESAVGEVQPLEILLPNRLRHDSSLYEEFFGCPVRFEQPVATIVLPASVAGLPLIDADPRMHRYLADYLAAAHEVDEKDDLLSRVRAAIVDVIDSPDTAQAEVARSLGMSRRTLQRRLREAGTTFQTILDDERRARALFLLRDPGLALYEIAFLLGYSEPSAFQRAFKRWTGVAAGAFRKELA